MIMKKITSQTFFKIFIFFVLKIKTYVEDPAKKAIKLFLSFASITKVRENFGKAQPFTFQYDNLNPRFRLL